MVFSMLIFCRTCSSSDSKCCESNSFTTISKCRRSIIYAHHKNGFNWSRNFSDCCWRYLHAVRTQFTGKAVSGNNQYQGAKNTHLPLKVNSASNSSHLLLPHF